MSADNWGVSSGRSDPLRSSLVERAKKRKVRTKKDAGWWAVEGSKALGDSYESYDVHLRTDGELWCACQNTKGGEYRTTCSHRTAVMLWREENSDPWEREGSAPQPASPPAPEFLDIGPGPVSTDVVAAVSDPASDDKAGEELLAVSSSADSFDRQRLEYAPIPAPEQLADVLKDMPFDPDRFPSFRPNQWEAIVDVVDAFEDGVKVVFLDAAPGCLSGETEIQYNRAGITRKGKLSYVVAKFNGLESPGKKKWDSSIPTRIRCGDIDRGIVQLGELRGAHESGTKPTFILSLEGGRSIMATADHRFYTEDGWLPLSEVKIGMRTFVDAGQGTGRRKEKSYYKSRVGLHHHPYAIGKPSAKKSGFQVPIHRLVYEAAHNGMGYNTFIGRLLDGDIEELEFFDPAIFAVHHKDHNSLNNDLSNLVLLTHLEHRLVHLREGDSNNVQYQLGLEKVISVSPNGEEATFDLELAEEPHNFIANGFVVHNSGKTVTAEAVRQLLDVKGAYACTTKTLQSQVCSDFPYAKELKGRANYPTLDLHVVRENEEPVTAADCNKRRETLPACVNCPGGRQGWLPEEERGVGMHCSWCHGVKDCPYSVAKRQALGARLAVINTPYLLAEGNSHFDEEGENLSGFANWPFYIIDEADQLEKVLLNYIQVELGPRVRKDLGIGLPTRIGVETAWTAWVEDEVVPAIFNKLHENQSAQLSIGAIPDVKADRRRKRLTDLLTKVQSLLETKELDDGEEVVELESGWVLDGWKEDDDPEKVKVTFKPIYVKDYARKYLWDLGVRFLLMSGTFISPDQVATDLGLKDDEWAVVSVPSTFPPERRPVLLRGETELNFSNKAESYPVIVRQINEILDDHPDERVLIHSVSYHLTSTIVRGIRDRHLPRVVSYTEAWQRARALEKFLTIDNGVMVSPSFDRGVDLKDDACFPSGTQILHADLSWRPIEETQPGDEIVGIDEETDRTHGYRLLRYGKVEAISSRVAPEVLRITTTKGVVTATPEHPFLTIIPSRRTSWRSAGKLRVGDRLRWVAEPVQRNESRLAGYLAGFFDGEGCVSVAKRQTGEYAGYTRLTICGVQQYGGVLDRVTEGLTELGISFRVTRRDHKGLYAPTAEVIIAGNLSAKLCFLSTIRPERLIERFNVDGMAGRDLFSAEILAIEKITKRQLVHNLTTTTGTYIADGYAVHNCRVIVVAKVPFPNRADKQVSARLYGTGRAGRIWYLVETIRTVCQMTGRGMRSEDDWCRTYILDKAFIKLFNENKRLFPKWWADAIVWDENDPKWVKALANLPSPILASP